MSSVPSCFISYSHDNENNKEWVLTLATKLVKNGVDVIPEQWDLRLGGDFS
ncbi:toll/interleukin-1 receptor domain-containing protein [Aliivibrio fischeri]|uniref:Sefir domain-containing protein n=1 Tax=Aliivibrio fischeri SR5 TaxID=1088719 RepID=A0AAV3ENA2_ALIFS|nr:toll/interleukin-1 receptor domain-containing protein [Aliivibrio fischeri]EHN68009.1 sefir domain-containing protein [Aliivibrio fischeri SR5]